MNATVLSSAAQLWPAAGRQWTAADRHWERGSLSFPVTADGRELRVTVIEDLAGLDALRPVWTNVGRRAAAQSAFLTWEWLRTWAGRYVRGSRRLLILAVADGADIIGIAPWYIDTVAIGPVGVRQIGFLGLPDAASDYLDVITAPAKERWVAHAIAAVLFGPLSHRWDTLSLRDIPAESPFLSRFVSAVRRAGKNYSIDEGSFCPGVHLPATFDDYLAHLSSHGRQAYRRKMRALRAKGHVRHVVLSGDEDVRRGLPTFRALYEKRWGRSEAAESLFALVTEYQQHAGSAWRVELSFLEVDGRAIAGLLHLTRGGVMYQYLMAVDRSFNKAASIGTLICGLSMEHAIKVGVTEYDFLKSEEEYKFQLMTHGRRAMNLTIHNRTARSLAAWTFRAAQSLGKILLR